jgi:pleiotropic regulator 1
LVLRAGGDNGSVWFWDWTSGHCFQQEETLVQPGSLEAEAGIYASAFDASGAWSTWACVAAALDQLLVAVYSDVPEAMPHCHVPQHLKVLV